MIGCDVKYDLGARRDEPATLAPGPGELRLMSDAAQWALLLQALQRNTRLRMITAAQTQLYNTRTSLIYQA